MIKYIIKDWAGNHLFKDREFDSFEDGCDFLLQEFPNDEDLQEYFVIPLIEINNMTTKLYYFKQQIREALIEHPELKQQILDIHDLCMLDVNDNQMESPFKSRSLDLSIDYLEQFLKDNTEESSFTDWTKEWETKYERDL